MNLLLDECVTNDLKADLVGHDVSTIEDAGFKGLKNGELLRAAFDVLVTVDQNLRFQQNARNFDIAILVLKARRSTYPLLKPLIPAALNALSTINAGEITVIE